MATYKFKINQQFNLKSFLFTDYDNTNTESISLPDGIHGNLDFKVMSELNYSNVTEIIIGKGEIQNIFNLPSTIKTFVCGRNNLKNLMIPQNIEILDISHNEFTSIDISRNKKLKILNASHNKLTQLNKIPLSVIELIINNNFICELNLQGLINLKKIDCNNNYNIELIDVPPDAEVSLLYDKLDINDNIKSGGKSKNNNFINQLEIYFKLKTQMENLNKNNSILNETTGKIISRNISNLKCPKCKKSGGAFFQKKNDTYIGYCQADKTCFRMKLTSPKDYNINEKLTSVIEKINESKEDVIKHKLDIIHAFIDNVDESEIIRFNKLVDEKKKVVIEYDKIFNDPKQSVETIQDEIDSLSFDITVPIKDKAQLQKEMLIKNIKLRQKNQVQYMKFKFHHIQNSKIVSSSLIQDKVNFKNFFVTTEEALVDTD
jgi:hypothetical protein